MISGIDESPPKDDGKVKVESRKNFRENMFNRVNWTKKDLQIKQGSERKQKNSQHKSGSICGQRAEEAQK